QVLRNFLSNAIKFTDQGEVAVHLSRSGDDRIAFTVRDTGTGIAEGKLEQIFRAFEQADTSSTRKHGGSGLGLAISRDLARLLKGEVHVESTPGEGSRFTLTLPRRIELSSA